jgi:glycosyltransferase involved in cell wall biosynthesis
VTPRAYEHAIGTICFPSYNRGKILLKTIKELLPTLGSEWSVLVVDNASTKDRGAYKEIEILAESSSYLYYFRHKKNGLFEGNLLSLFDLVQTQFFLVVSDEDFPSIEALDQMVPFLENNRDIGGIRTSLGTLPGVQKGQAVTFKDMYFSKGEGISLFGLNGNYITGQIYNAPLLNELNIPQRLKKNIHANQWYPHLYLNVLAAANSRTMLSSSITCYEGTTDAYRPEETKDYFGPFSYGTRVDQFIALRNVIYEGYIDIKNSGKAQEFDISGFYETYRQLCSKYQFLIFVAQGGMYKDQLINLDFLLSAFSLLCLSSVEKLPNYERIRESLASNLSQSGKHWLELRQKYDKAPTAAEKNLILAQLV